MADSAQKAIEDTSGSVDRLGQRFGESMLWRLKTVSMRADSLISESLKTGSESRGRLNSMVWKPTEGTQRPLLFVKPWGLSPPS